MYFFGGEFNIDDPHIDEDVKKKLKNVERDVFSWEVYILDLSNIGGSGDSLLDKLLECSTSMNSGKASPRAFVADGKICMVGSTIKMSISDICKIKDLDLKNFAYFEIYDPIDDKWTKLPNPPHKECEHEMGWAYCCGKEGCPCSMAAGGKTTPLFFRS